MDGNRTGLDGEREENRPGTEGDSRVVGGGAVEDGDVDGAGRGIQQRDADEEDRRGDEVDGEEQSPDPEPAPRAGHREEGIGGQEHDLDEHEEVEDVAGEDAAVDAADEDEDERGEEGEGVLLGPGREPEDDDRCQPGDREHDGGEGVGDERDGDAGDEPADLGHEDGGAGEVLDASQTPSRPVASGVPRSTIGGTPAGHERA